MIIYFSGTGNSRYAAEYIGLVTEDTVVDAKDYIQRKKTADFTSDKPYVFVCPTYAWRIPRLFSEWIQKGEFTGNPQAYFVMTCGDSIGGSSAYLEQLCREKKFKYKGVAPIVMPENYIALYPVPDREESARILAAADGVLKEVSLTIKKGKNLPTASKKIVAALQSTLINPLFYTMFVSAKGFYVTDKCIDCGKCRMLCPCNNITMGHGHPHWENVCTHCMACISGCPTEAIEYKKKSVGKRRYYNTTHPLPDVK